MQPILFPRICHAASVIPALLLAQAGAEPVTITIQPSVAYTVKNLSGGVYQDKQSRLYSNGYTGTDYRDVESFARMEFQIPPAVLVGLQSMEFRAVQDGLVPSDTGYTYLWYYQGNVGETTKAIPYARDSFTAEAVHDGEFISRNLLNSSALPTEKFGLIISTRLATKKEVTFEDAQLVVTYEPPPKNNAEAVSLLLAGPGKPFEGETDPAVTGFDADPDHDGMANVFEVWRGTAPDHPYPAPAPFFGTITSSQGQVPYIRVLVDKDADDRMLVGAQASHNLVDWRDISATRTTQTSGGLTYAKFTDVIPLAARGTCYFRFVAEPEGKKFE